MSASSDEGRPLESDREATGAMGTDQSSDRSIERLIDSGKLSVHHNISIVSLYKPPFYYMHSTVVLETQMVLYPDSPYITSHYKRYRQTENPDEVDCLGCLEWLHA